MHHYLLYNGSFHKNSEPLVAADNRGFRYGDGLFETIRVTNHTIHFADWHFERLFAGLHLLQFEPPAWFNAQYLARQVLALCKKNNHPAARIRINLFRGNGGLYDPENHTPNCIIQSWPLEQEHLLLNQNGLVTGIYTDTQKAIDLFCNIKSNNYLPYAMAALHAKKKQWNDAFVINTAGHVCDATIANVFMVQNETVYTPPLQEGCVAGIMRRHLLQQLPALGFTVHERLLTIDDLLQADEVFLTNSIKGIRWVSRCGPAVYNNTLTVRLFNRLFKK